MSTHVTQVLARLGVQSGPPELLGRVGRLYVLDADRTAAALAELGPQAHVVPAEGLVSHVVRGTTRPVGWWRLPGRRRFVACGDVERTEIDLANGTAFLDRELGTDRLLVRTWGPRDGTELDQILWWHGHSVAARLHPRG